MKMNQFLISLSFIFLPVFLFGNWLSFRGDAGNGLITQSLSPNIGIESESAWKIDLPGRGLSSPIIVEKHVFLTASSGPKQKTLHILAFEIETGKKSWERKFKATGRTICHEKTCVAAPTMVSNGEVVVAQFSSNDIFCLDLRGNLKWLRGLTYDYPNAANGLGMSSSPVIANGVLIAQVENDAESFTAGLKLLDGTTIWKKDRPRGANWTSPTVFGNKHKPRVALQSKDGIAIIDPLSGEDQWTFQQGASTIPSSTVNGDIILVPSNGLTALQSRPDGKSHTQLWQDNKLGPGTASPTISGDKFYVINKANVLTCAQVDSGEIIWRMRLKGPMSGSPITTSEHLFVFNEDGLGQFIRLGEKEGEEVATVQLEETILCTPAAAKGSLYVRSDKSLWKISD
jgi:outer membrane protein assembly factor BamB